MLRSFALLVSLIALPADDEAATTDRPMVLRVHSLAGLVERHGDSAARLSLLPLPIGSGRIAHDLHRHEPSNSPIDAEDLVALVREVVEPDLWDEGTARVDLLAHHPTPRLLVFAPTETQDQVAGFIERLAGPLAATPVLEVRVLHGTPAGETRLFTTTAAAEAIGEELGVARRLDLALRSAAIGSASAFAGASTVFDWESEIAQAGIIGDPITLQVQAGIELLARAVPAEGGMLLALALREAEHAAEIESRPVEGNGLIVAQQLPSERTTSGLVQHARFGFVAYAGSCFLPADTALLMPVTVATHLGEVAFTLDVRLRGELPAARARHPVKPRAGADREEGEQFQVELLSRGWSALGFFDSNALPRSLFEEGWLLDQDEPSTVVDLHSDDGGERTVELARMVAGEVLDTGNGRLSTCGPYLLTRLPDATIDDIAATLDTLDQHGAGEIAGRVLADGQEVGRFRVPYVDGRPLVLWSGAQGARIADFDVDVANNAQMANPEIESWVDGFALRLDVSRDARGRIVVHANGVLNFLDQAPQRVELRDQSRLALEQLQARRLFFDEIRVVNEKASTMTFGGSELALELEIKPR